MKRIREISDEMCARFDEDIKELKMQAARFLERHREFAREEWLGGDQDSNNFEAPPAACRRAIRHVRRAVYQLDKADREVAMFRAGVAPAKEEGT